jgi:hypothetical protein
VRKNVFVGLSPVMKLSVIYRSQGTGKDQIKGKGWIIVLQITESKKGLMNQNVNART